MKPLHVINLSCNCWMKDKNPIGSFNFSVKLTFVLLYVEGCIVIMYTHRFHWLNKFISNVYKIKFFIKPIDSEKIDIPYISLSLNIVVVNDRFKYKATQYNNNQSADLVDVGQHSFFFIQSMNRIFRLWFINTLNRFLNAISSHKKVIGSGFE